MIGSLVVLRTTAGSFEHEVVSLLQTFATQSALAIQNARLFRADSSVGQPAQVGVPGQHVPRAPDAAQRHHRLQRDAARRKPRTWRQEAFVPDLRKINAAGKHLLELINAVLDLSKIEAGRMDLYLETFSVPRLVEEIAAVIQPLADKNGNRVEVRCDPAVGRDAGRPDQGAPGAVQPALQRLQVHRARARSPSPCARRPAMAGASSSST